VEIGAEYMLMRMQLFIGVMSALYSVWDIVCSPSFSALIAMLTIETV
jgi:hypothetical protein